MVLVSFLIIKIKERKSTKSSKAKLTIFITILIFQSIFLIPSYYAGWEKGEYYYNEKLFYVNCYSLSHGSECLEKPPFHGMELAFDKEYLEIINYWASENKGIFGEQKGPFIYKKYFLNVYLLLSIGEDLQTVLMKLEMGVE